jgi:hypothetical protein
MFGRSLNIHIHMKIRLELGVKNQTQLHKTHFMFYDIQNFQSISIKAFLDSCFLAHGVRMKYHSTAGSGRSSSRPMVSRNCMLTVPHVEMSSRSASGTTEL